MRLVYAQARVTRVTRKQAVATAVTPAVPAVARSGHCHTSRLLIFGLILAATFSGPRSVTVEALPGTTGEGLEEGCSPRGR